MAHLVIKNIGPIKNVDIDLNKINVFIGPQSSGKSTIAKIISYCTWVEKDVATHLSLEKYENNTSFIQNLITFHKMGGYFRDESVIEYKSNVILIKATLLNTFIEWIDKYSYYRNKISYIPAERNMVMLPEMEKMELMHNNVRSFLFDWFTARKIYTKESAFNILSLSLSYYYDSNFNRIKANNGEYDILLDNASSGLQSLVPLVVIVEYLMQWIYQHEEELSFEEKIVRRKVNIQLHIEKVLKPFSRKEILTDEEVDNLLDQITELIEKQDISIMPLIEEWIQLKEKIFTISRTNLIIEEPEQNLFPETQRDLIYYLLSSFNNGRENGLTITTHSPYVLLAINNCMMGYVVKDKLKDTQLLSKNSWIDPIEVSVWEIHNGELKSIKDEKTNTIGKHYFNRNMNSILDEYYSMLKHLEI